MLSQHNKTDPSAIHDKFRLINKILQLVGFCITTLKLVKNKDFCHLEYDFLLFILANIPLLSYDLFIEFSSSLIDPEKAL